MHPLFGKADRHSTEVNGAATLVHRIMGPGLFERSLPIGLLFNFHEVKFVDGISWLILPGANEH
jgi:hypothetical protein